MEINDMVQKDSLLGIFNEDILSGLKNRVSEQEFIRIMGLLVDHSIKAEADLSYDFNTAINRILQKFPGQIKVTVSQVHETLRELGIVDYKGSDFQYIEETLKGFGMLVVPDQAA